MVSTNGRTVSAIGNFLKQNASVQAGGMGASPKISETVQRWFEIVPNCLNESKTVKAVLNVLMELMTIFRKIKRTKSQCGLYKRG